MANLIQLCSVPYLESSDDPNTINPKKKIKFSVEILKPALIPQKQQQQFINGNSIGSISTSIDHQKENSSTIIPNNQQINTINTNSTMAHTCSSATVDKNTIIEHRTIYHIVKPNDLGLKLRNSTMEVTSNDISCENYRLLAKKRSQKKRSLLEKQQKSQCGGQQSENQQQNDKQMVNNSNQSSTTLKTRCGRISRPPNHMKTFINEIPTLIDTHPTKPMATPNELIILPTSNERVPPPIPFAEKSDIVKRNIPNYYRCNTCQKIYLGKNKRARHLKNFPTHEMPALPPPDITNSTRNAETELINNEEEILRIKSSNIFDFLMAKIDNHSKSCEQSRTAYFLNQLSEFVEKMNCVKSKILCSNNNNNNSSSIEGNNNKNSLLTVASSNLQYIDKNVSRIFGIEEGNYYVNLDSIFSTNNGLKIPTTEFNEMNRVNLEAIPPSTTSLGYGEVTELFPVVVADPSTTTSAVVVGSHCFTANSSNANCAVADDVVGAVGGLGEESLFAAVHGINLDELGHTTLRNNLLSFDDIISDNAVERPTNSSPSSQKLDFSNLINS